MGDMTPEERVRQAKLKSVYISDDDANMAQAIREAVAVEREANCKAVCVNCRENVPLDTSNRFHKQVGFGISDVCQAAAIRSRADG